MFPLFSVAELLPRRLPTSDLPPLPPSIPISRFNYGTLVNNRFLWFGKTTLFLDPSTRRTFVDAHTILC